MAMESNYPAPPKWTNKKSGLPLALAFLSAASSDFTYEILKDPNAYYKKYGLMDLPPIDVWLSYYTSEDIYDEWFSNRFEEELENPGFINLIIEILKYVKRRTRSLKENSHKLTPFFTKKDIIKFAEWLNDTDLDSFKKNIDIESKFKNKFSNCPIKVFLNRVWLPCYYYYGDIPQNLYKKAINGDFKSFCNLLRIDKLIIKDKKLFEMFQKVSLDTDSEQFKTISRVFGASVKINSRKKIKEIKASIISASSETYGTKLTAPEIQSLFDHVAKLKDKDALQDIDIESCEALAKHIQRQAPLFKKLFKN
jgi:hypothetical protein